MNTSISEKEKRVLIILGVFVLIFLYVYFFFLPKLKVINKLKDKIIVYEDEYRVNRQYIDRVNNLDSELKVLYQKQRNIWDILPPIVNYDEILYILNQAVKDSKVTFNDLKFENTTVIDDSSKDEEDESTESDEEEKENKAKDKKEKSENIKDQKLVQAMKFFGLGQNLDDNDKKVTQVNEGEGFYISVDISLKGSYSQIKTFIKNIKQRKNKMEFVELNIENTLEIDLEASMKINIYGIKDSTANNYTLLTNKEKTDVKKSTNKNIFGLVNGIDSNILNSIEGKDNLDNNYTEIDKDILEKVGKYDFSIRLVPFSNNLAPPAITVSAKNIVKNFNEPDNSIIYGDGNKMIYVDFELEEKNNKYFVKYRTEQDAFPETSFTDLAEFKPISDKITLVIDANDRRSKNDKSGINLNIINKTKKEFIIKVLNDDKENPRLEVGDISKNVKFEFTKNE